MFWPSHVRQPVEVREDRRGEPGRPVVTIDACHARDTLDFGVDSLAIEDDLVKFSSACILRGNPSGEP